MSEHAIPEYWVNITRLLPAGEVVSLSVDADILALLTPAVGVDAFHAFEVKLALKPWRKDGAVIKGAFKGEVEQTCVAMLEPMKNSIQADFERYFIPDHGGRNPKPDIVDGEMILDPVEDNFPDIVSGEKINLWEIVIEEINLEIDPFPRSVDAMPGLDASEDQEEQEPTQNPFADLKALITEKKS